MEEGPLPTLQNIWGGKKGERSEGNSFFFPAYSSSFRLSESEGKERVEISFSPSASFSPPPPLRVVTRQKPKGRSIPAKESEKKGKKKKKHHNNFEKSGANKALRGGEEGEEGLSYSDPVIRGSGRKSPPPFLPSFKFFDLEARGQSEKKLLQKHMCRRRPVLAERGHI